MNKEQFYATLADTSRLDASTLPDLTDMVAEFPYFEIGRMLLVKNLHLIGNARFESELRRAAVHVSDRQVLYDLVHGGHTAATIEVPTAQPDATPEAPTVATVPTTGDYFAEASDDMPEEFELPEPVIPAYTIEEDAPHIEPGERYSFSQWLDYVNNAPATDEAPTTPAERSTQLIDRFLQSEGKPSEPSKPMSREEIEHRVDLSTRENEDILTETLAGIYIKQGQYAKAIGIFRKLTLKYPEKSVYFASRISEIEHNIKNS